MCTKALHGVRSSVRAVVRAGLLCYVVLAAPGAVAVIIPVNCNGMLVGNIDVNTNAGGSVSGAFTSVLPAPPAAPTLAAAAAACGEDHFNWYQIVTADNHPPNNRAGNPIPSPPPPYVDPPPGGYGAPGTPGSQWADQLPWYYDEYPAPAGTPDADAGLTLPANTFNDHLNYGDMPGGSPNTNLSFSTWLVSLNADSSFHAFEGGFSWNWSNATGTNVASNLVGGIANPTAAQYSNIIGNFAATIPEPSPLSLMGAGLACLVLVRRGKRRSRAAA